MKADNRLQREQISINGAEPEDFPSHPALDYSFRKPHEMQRMQHYRRVVILPLKPLPHTPSWTFSIIISTFLFKLLILLIQPLDKLLYVLFKHAVYCFLSICILHKSLIFKSILFFGCVSALPHTLHTQQVAALQRASGTNKKNLLI